MVICRDDRAGLVGGRAVIAALAKRLHPHHAIRTRCATDWVRP